MAKLTPSQAAFLEQPFYAVVTTLRRDGSPHSTVVWQEPLPGGEGISFNITTGRRKFAELERDPRVSLIVVDPDDPYRWVAVSGQGEIVPETGEEQIHRLSMKYRGRRYEIPEGDVRVTVNVRAERVTGYKVD